MKLFVQVEQEGLRSGISTAQAIGQVGNVLEMFVNTVKRIECRNRRHLKGELTGKINT